MVDPTEFERAAMRACLKFFGEAAGEIGFDKPLGHYSEAEALQVIEAIVTGWTEAMAFHATGRRSIRRCGDCAYETQAPQPVVSCWSQPRHRSPSIRRIPFADLEDDLPWETEAVTAWAAGVGGQVMLGTFNIAPPS